MNRAELENLISRFRSLKVMVLGDFMLDQFIWGKVDRISPEAPVPILEVEKETVALGGAGNVVKNVRSLGAEILPVGVVGQDWAGETILQLLSQVGVPSNSVLKTSRPTTLKTRILAQKQQIARVDREERSFVSQEVQDQLAENFLSNLDIVDGVIISDYSKGTITPGLLSRILPVAREKKKLVCLDPKVRHFPSYSPVTVLTPNQMEASAVLGYPILSEDDLREAGRRILATIDCSALLITRGEKGMALFRDGQMMLIAARAHEVYDVTGAGDTVISVLCVALAAGCEMLEAVTLTNLAAGIVVGKVGTASVSPTELLHEFQ